jgi:23S rRNA (adenine1618-N6)-methyltransferase
MNSPLYGAKKKKPQTGDHSTPGHSPSKKIFSGEGSASDHEASDKGLFRPRRLGKRNYQLHPRSAHQGSYDFDQLCEVCPELKPHVFTNEHGTQTIKFDNQDAIRELNKALLKLHYQINNWTLPPGHLIPPIPGRADYIHYLQDLMGDKDHQVRGIDIGVGANCIYPLLGASIYNWDFVGVDISQEALINGQKILLSNMDMIDKIELRHQPHPKKFFQGVIRSGERFDFVMCNPPFFESPEEAQGANDRKNKNLGLDQGRNFAGKNHELWAEGGELGFLSELILESRDFGGQARMFTSLVSKEDHIKPLRRLLSSMNAEDVQIVEMGQGNKKSRILVWRFAPMGPQA